MGVMPVNKLLVTMSLPIVISMLIQAMYNLVDSVFVAQINPDALTAVGMAFPMQSLMIAFQTGLGVGMNALVSRYLGQKKPYEAGLAATHALILTALNYVIFLIVVCIYISNKRGIRPPKTMDVKVYIICQILTLLFILALGNPPFYYKSAGF